MEEETKGIEITIVEMDGKETKITIPTDYFNVLFYKNKITSVPSGDFVENIHKTWFFLIFFVFINRLKSLFIQKKGKKIMKSWSFIMVMFSGCFPISINQGLIVLRIRC